MTESEAVWGALITAGVLYEAYTLTNRKPSDTLSETTRSVFRIKSSKVGRAVFGTGWIAFAAWFWGHILYGWPFPGL